MTPDEGAAGQAHDLARIINDGAHPLTVIVAPAGGEHVLAPGDAITVTANGPAGPRAELLVERSCDFALVSAWPGATVRVQPHRAG